MRARNHATGIAAGEAVGEGLVEAAIPAEGVADMAAVGIAAE